MSTHPIAKSGTRKRRPGRPSKLTPEVMTTIVSAIKCGAPDKVACAAVGIHPATLCDWKNKAAERPRSEYSKFAGTWRAQTRSSAGSSYLFPAVSGRAGWRVSGPSPPSSRSSAHLGVPVAARPAREGRPKRAPCPTARDASPPHRDGTVDRPSRPRRERDPRHPILPNSTENRATRKAPVSTLPVSATHERAAT